MKNSVQTQREPVVLAFDTALGACSAALYAGPARASAQESRKMDYGQAEHLVPMIQSVLATAGTVFADLTEIRVTRGPGAFTGIRIGLSTARALGLALDIPVRGMVTTEVIAAAVAQFHPARNMLAVLETKRRDFYYQLFAASGDAMMPPRAGEAHDILEAVAGDDSFLVAGDGAARFRGQAGNETRLEWTSGFDIPDVAVMARMAVKEAESGASPLYLREADVSTPKKGLRVLTGMQE